jgi:hypothetical protein
MIEPTDRNALSSAMSDAQGGPEPKMAPQSSGKSSPSTTGSADSCNPKPGLPPRQEVAEPSAPLITELWTKLREHKVVQWVWGTWRLPTPCCTAQRW